MASIVGAFFGFEGGFFVCYDFQPIRVRSGVIPYLQLHFVAEIAFECGGGRIVY